MISALHLKGKSKWMPKVSTRKEREPKKHRENKWKQKLIFETINKIDKLLAKLNKQNKKEKAQNTSIRNKKADITTEILM